MHIEEERNLPPGELISGIGGELELPDKQRKDLMAWNVSKNGKKMLWILSTKATYNNNYFAQLVKNAETAGYKIVHRGTIDNVLLNNLYDKATSLENQKRTGEDSAVIAFFEKLLQDALNEGVSDIHIEVRAMGGIIRMRKNGEMLEYGGKGRLSYQEALSLGQVIYNVLAATKDVTFDARVCQQAAVPYNVNGQELRLRYQSVPAYPDGFDIIMRVLIVGRSEDFVPLQKLGYTEQQVKQLMNITSRTIGGLVIAGVTGSGKSTTLKNLLMFINAESGYRSKIYTIEDPPEYAIAKVTQIPVVIGKDFDPTKMSPFEAPIKACMRGDPDIIMIGEVRDKVTGDLTKKAIQSGHQVLTTVHATSALGILDRLVDFGVSYSVLGSPDFMQGLLYQKLLPVLCPKCSIPFNREYLSSKEATQNDLELFERILAVTPNVEDYPIKIRNESGCPHCRHTGIIGRTVAAEIIDINLPMLQLIQEGKTVPLMIYWRNQSNGDLASPDMRGKTCMEHGYYKMLCGEVSPYDIEGEFKPINEMMLVLDEASSSGQWEDL